MRGGGLHGRRDGGARARSRRTVRPGDRRRAGDRSRERARRRAARRHPRRRGGGALRGAADGRGGRRRGRSGRGARFHRPARARAGPGQQPAPGAGRGDDRARAGDWRVPRRPLVRAPRGRGADPLRRFGESPGGAAARAGRPGGARHRGRDVLARRKRRRRPLPRRDRRGAGPPGRAAGAGPAGGRHRARLRVELHPGRQPPRAAGDVQTGRPPCGAGVRPPALAGRLPARRRSRPLPGSDRQRGGHRRGAPRRAPEQHRRGPGAGGARDDPGRPRTRRGRDDRGVSVHGQRLADRVAAVRRLGRPGAGGVQHAAVGGDGRTAHAPDVRALPAPGRVGDHARALGDGQRVDRQPARRHHGQRRHPVQRRAGASAGRRDVRAHPRPLRPRPRRAGAAGRPAQDDAAARAAARGDRAGDGAQGARAGRRRRRPDDLRPAAHPRSGDLRGARQALGRHRARAGGRRVRRARRRAGRRRPAGPPPPRAAPRAGATTARGESPPLHSTGVSVRRGAFTTG